MINQAIHIDGLDNYLLCPMQCPLNCINISEFPQYLAEIPSETTHATELVNPLDAAHPLIIPLQLNSVASYFDAYSLSVTEYENEVIPIIHLIAKEPPWDPSASKYS